MDVNADNAKQVGDRILSSMESKSVSEYSFKRTYQAVTLQDKPTINVCIASFISAQSGLDKIHNALWLSLIPRPLVSPPVSSQGHYGFHSFPVVDWFCLFIIAQKLQDKKKILYT
jgi:hypothetical protein